MIFFLQIQNTILMPFTSAQKRHYRRSKIRKECQIVQDQQEQLQFALDNDDVSLAVSIVYNYPQFRTQLLLCNAQSIRMCQALIGVGVPCNYWTLEGAET